MSVLFVDLVGFTALSETRDAEDVRELLSGYFDTTRTIVSRYGGVVEKFIGDAVMAVWGAPAAREDDAERAVRAALDIVEAVAAFGTEIGADLRARGGVVTGSVATYASPGEGLVAGDRVNTASRVQSIAEPDTVLVDETTRRTTSAAIAYVDAGEHIVKGKSEPLHLWRADRVVAGVGGSQRVDGLEARFIGRDADLRLVKDLFHACSDRKSARLVSIVGAAGVGKSRLRWEFDKYVDGLVDFVSYHSGRCLSYGEGVAYAALAEMVRQRFQVAEDDPADIASARLVAGLDELIADATEREFLLPRLGALLGVADVDLGREELFAGWRLFFERLATREPVVLAFEDMQWADTGLLDFIEHLLDWAASSPIFIITFARPELAESRTGWATGRRNATSLYLEPLAPNDMGELLDDLVADLPTDLRDRIVERAEGIPLYALETVRSLIDRDAVVPKDGVYRLVGDVGDLDVPTTLTMLLAARIDALASDERSLVKDLAVLGGSFPRSTVSAVSQLDDSLLDRLLAVLVRQEFLSVRTDKLSPDRGQYIFAQSMLRDVAYEMLSKHERKARHLAVAAHLRSTFENDGEDAAEVIAAHYRHALRAAESDPDADEIRQEALNAYERAGRRASTLGAPETAMRVYLSAAELADGFEDELSWRERAAEMALAAGRHQDTYDLFSSLRADCEAAGRKRDWARLAVGHARGHARLNRHGEAITVLKAAMEVLDDGTFSPELAHTAAWLGNFMTFAGRPADGAPYTEQALIVAQALGLPRPLCQALNTRAVALVFLDRFQEGLIHGEAALALSRRHGLPDQEETALIMCSDMAMTEDLPIALEYGEQAVATCQRRGNRYSETISASNFLFALLYLGQWDRAERTITQLSDAGGDERPNIEFMILREATLATWRGDAAVTRRAVERLQSLRGSDAMDDECTLAMADAMLANLEGRHADAVEAGVQVLDRMRVQIAVRHEAVRQAWTDAVDGAIALDDFDRAQELLERVTTLPAGFVPPHMRADGARHAGRIAAARGEHDQAAALFQEAEEIWTGLGYRYWLARAQLDHAEWAAGRDDPAAGVLAAAAGSVFEELRADIWAERARAVQAEVGSAAAQPVDGQPVDLVGSLEVQEMAHPG